MIKIMTRSAMVLGLSTVAFLVCGPAHAKPAPAAGPAAPLAKYLDEGGGVLGAESGDTVFKEVNDLQCTVGLGGLCGGDNSTDDIAARPGAVGEAP
jgi:hypothetical protein